MTQAPFGVVARTLRVSESQVYSASQPLDLVGVAGTDMKSSGVHIVERDDI